MIPDQLLDEVAHRFALLSDPTRLRILSTIYASGEISVGELVDLNRVSRSNLSQHLSRLAAAGLVGRRRDGTTVYYRIIDESLRQLCDLVCNSLRQRARSTAES
jgi:DNA-binding transcriptional ArsR family regulator